MNSKNWQKVGYAPQPLVKLDPPDDEVQAQFKPDTGSGWRIDCQGKPTVGFKQNRLSMCTVAGCFQCACRL